MQSREALQDLEMKSPQKGSQRLTQVSPPFQVEIREPGQEHRGNHRALTCQEQREHTSFTTARSCSKHTRDSQGCSKPPTNAVPSLPADASNTLDVGPGSGGRLIPLHLGQQVLCEF